METKILQKLKEVEREHQVEVLFAVESGSRAWGFASPDSDYDIRFVYRHSKEWYLNLWEQKDTIQFMTEDDLDGSGWDIRKALLLLSKTNASFLGWLYSPIVYFEKEGILKEFQQLAERNFNPIPAFHHYHSMNKGFEEVLGADKVNVKRFFYFFRTVLAARWVVMNNTNPPVLFRDMYGLIEPEVASQLDALIEEKGQTAERGNVVVSKYLIDCGRALQVENGKLMKELKGVKVMHEEFNSFFLKIIK